MAGFNNKKYRQAYKKSRHCRLLLRCVQKGLFARQASFRHFDSFFHDVAAVPGGNGAPALGLYLVVDPEFPGYFLLELFGHHAPSPAHKIASFFKDRSSAYIFIVPAGQIFYHPAACYFEPDPVTIYWLC